MLRTGAQFSSIFSGCSARERDSSLHFSGCSAQKRDLMKKRLNFDDASRGSAIFIKVFRFRILRTGAHFSSKFSACSARERDFLPKFSGCSARGRDFSENFQDAPHGSINSFKC